MNLRKRQTHMLTAYLGLGTNQGERRGHLQAAVDRLSASEAIRVHEASPVYETDAHTRPSSGPQPSFLNAVLRATVACSPEALLRTAHAVEAAEGRTRPAERWAPRPLDIDLLVVGRVTQTRDALTLPHPRLAERRFVLRPWADLAPNFLVPPPFEAPVHRLLADCPDDAAIRRTTHTLRVRPPDAPFPGAL